jgi:hypothetical protein
MQTPQPSFAADIKPLFRERDRASMTFMFDLWDYDDVVANAGDILATLEAGEMPCDGTWPSDRVELLKRWVDGGHRP